MLLLSCSLNVFCLDAGRMYFEKVSSDEYCVHIDSMVHKW